MTKNVNVVDDLGNRYVPTYAKRAKGLVKNGRARWVDENTICLACPPDELDLEDAEMENKINPINGMIVESRDSEQVVAGNGLNLRDILERMDKIIAQGDELRNIVFDIQNLPVNDSPNGGFDGQARAQAIESIVCNREANNERMLKMLDKMYEDMMGRTVHVQGMPSKEPNAAVLDAIRDLDFVGMSSETAKVVLDALMGK